MENPPVSVLVVTEDRPEFMPWLLWNFARQSYRHRELVIVDSSKQPLESESPVVRVVTMPKGTPVGLKFNRAIAEARGDFVTLWGDDDWQHPDRLKWSVDTLLHEDEINKIRPEVVGWFHGWFVELETERCCFYKNKAVMVASTATLARGIAKSVAFDAELSASDTRWIEKITKDYGFKQLDRDQIHSLWLVHDRNMTKRRSYTWTHTLEAVAKFVVPEAWGDTTRQLANLRSRLRGSLKP